MRTPVEDANLPGRTFEHHAAGRALDGEAWERTDRPLRFHKRRPEATETEATLLALHRHVRRTRWLMENQVYTEFLDAGIGCCWLASQGDKEASGETEEAAIRRLARENGMKLWREVEHGRAVGG